MRGACAGSKVTLLFASASLSLSVAATERSGSRNSFEPSCGSSTRISKHSPSCGLLRRWTGYIVKCSSNSSGSCTMPFLVERGGGVKYTPPLAPREYGYRKSGKATYFWVFVSSRIGCASSSACPVTAGSSTTVSTDLRTRPSSIGPRLPRTDL